MTPLKEKELIVSSIKAIDESKSKFMFYVPTVQTPNTSVYEVYFQANVLMKLGYDVTMLTDGQFVKPDYIESELLQVPHVSSDKNKLTVSNYDVLVIPETYSNVLEMTKNLPCIRVGLLQSFDYMLNALTVGMGWQQMGIKNILTTSNEVKKLMVEYYGENTFDIKSYQVGIPEYFKKPTKPKQPVIGIVGRNSNEMSKVIKLFYAKNPHLNFVTFDTIMTETNPPKHTDRENFAKRISSFFAVLWIDRISSFGTLPLEAMKTGTIPVGIVPDITPDYLIGEDGKSINCGVWVNNLYDLPIILGDVLDAFLNDSIPDETYEKMEEVSSIYTQENSSQQLTEYYKGLLLERRESLVNRLEVIEESLGKEESTQA